MKISLIIAHPNPESFNHAIAHTAARWLQQNGHEVLEHDLHAENFDPILPYAEIPEDAVLPPAIQSYCREIREVDGFVIVHPNWWGQPPAILKGWIDRVFRAGIAYRFVAGVPQGLLKARKAVVFNTANTPEDVEKKIYGDPLQLIWKNCTFDMCQIPDFHRQLFTSVIISTPEQRRQWLHQVEVVLGRIFPAEI